MLTRRTWLSQPAGQELLARSTDCSALAAADSWPRWVAGRRARCVQLIASTSRELEERCLGHGLSRERAQLPAVHHRGHRRCPCGDLRPTVERHVGVQDDQFLSNIASREVVRTMCSPAISLMLRKDPPPRTTNRTVKRVQ